METQKFDFFCWSSKFEFWLLTKSWNHLSFVNISPTLVIDTSMERFSRVLHHGNPEMLNFFKKFEIDEIEFCPYPEFPYAKKKNRPGFVNISPTLVIDTSTERSSRVQQHGTHKNWFFFKKVRNWIRLVFFDLCWRAEIIQVGLNMHLYVDIGDASSSLWGSTSSFEVTNMTFLSKKKLASNVQSSCIDNSKWPKSEFWHYCIKVTKWAIY